MPLAGRHVPIGTCPATIPTPSRVKKKDRPILNLNFPELTKRAKTVTHSVSVSSAVILFLFYSYMQLN